jgi:hypothetical protein
MDIRERTLLALTICLAAGVFLMFSPARAEQPCATCRATDIRTMVSFSPVVSANRLVFDDIDILDTRGAPLDPALYSLIPSTNDDGSAYANGPVLMVDSKVGFTIGLNGKAVQANQPFTVTVVRSGDTRSVSLEDLNTALTGQVGFDPVGALMVRGVSLRKVQVTHTYETANTSYRFVGIEPTASAETSLSMRTYGTRKRVIFRDTHDLASNWSLQLRSSAKSTSSRFHANNVRVPRGDQLVIVYGEWHGASGRPALWLDRHSDGRLDTRLPLNKG